MSWFYAQMRDPYVRALVLLMAMEDNLANKWFTQEEKIRRQYIRLVRTD